MSRCVPRLLWTAGLFLYVVCHASASGAEPKDAAALDLAQKAIFTDYLGTNFIEAEKKLKQALDMCKGKACSDIVKAQLHRDLGVVYVGGLNRRDEGKALFIEALKMNPTIRLDTDLASPEIEAVFSEAKRSAGAGEAAPAGPPASAQTETAPAETPKAPPTAKGDLIHTPPAEQTILTPVPLYAELPAGTSAAKVRVSYKPFGSDTWKSLDMARVRQGYGVEIPCFDVGSTTGDLKYFIQATDAENNLVSYSGTRNDPQKVPIKAALDGDPPHLPGQAPPARCADPGDCPPEFPGCKSQGGDQPPCEQTGDCPAAPAADAKKNWLSVAFQQDFLIAGSATDVCGAESAYTCFRESGDYYDGIPLTGKGGEVAGGIGLSTSRIMAGYDRAIGPITLGARVGFAFGGGPTAPGGNGFFPVHGEARAAYWFGTDPFGRKGFRPYVVLGGGVAQVDGRVSVGLYETQQAFQSNRLSRMDAWRKTGLGFVTGGAGLLFAIVPRTGPCAEVKVMQTFGGSPANLGTSLSVQLGYAFGF